MRINNSKTTLDPAQFIQLAKLVNDVPDTFKKAVRKTQPSLKKAITILSSDIRDIKQVTDSLDREMEMSIMTNSNPFKPIEDLQNDTSKYTNVINQTSLIHVTEAVAETFLGAYSILNSIVENLIPGSIIMTEFDHTVMNKDRVQNLIYEMELNRTSIERFTSALNRLEEAKRGISSCAVILEKLVEKYFQFLLHRHTVLGIEIHRDPLITDVAISIFENIDSHGEIQDGTNPEELSTYSLGRAMIMTQAVNSGLINKFISSDDQFIKYITDGLLMLWEFVDSLSNISNDIMSKYKNIIAAEHLDFDINKLLHSSSFDLTIKNIKSLNPQAIKPKPVERILSKEERFNLEFSNKTTATIADMLSNVSKSDKDIVRYVLDRKASLRKFFEEENTFYVCKIGAGNMFTGEAPGGLQVIPGQRPTVKFDEIVGTGFDEIKDFLAETVSADQWHDLFMATSPSRSTDKSNVLMIGPMGCLAGDTFVQFKVTKKDGTQVALTERIESLYSIFNNNIYTDYLALSMSDKGDIIYNNINGVISTGEKECYQITVEGGERIVATDDHRFFTNNGYVTLKDLNINNKIFLNRASTIAVEDTIISIEPVGKKKTYDVQMNAPFHNYVANGFVVHNCGKTEILRAVGGDKESLGIFAQGSDFLTCWKGEAQKNPKRLFEAGLKLQKKTSKHVHFLIDEIDSVLNNDKKMDDDGLSLEFQILMDGVVQYPGLSVWGATNNPGRIPMPMIRRFNKVLIVGELNVEHRVKLLQTFVGFMPTVDFNDEAWNDLAEQLEGATGDIIRKTVDHLWRSKMRAFVTKHSAKAEELVKYLNEINDNKKFDISEFTNEERRVFHNMLRQHVVVTPDDVEMSIKKHLRNAAIRSEMETAVNTYSDARSFMAAMR